VAGWISQHARTRLEDVLDELAGRSPSWTELISGIHIVADYPQDPADAGTNWPNLIALRRYSTREARRLLVRDALVRLDNGTYGVCVDCGKPCPRADLEFKPEAARCLTCQAKRDRMRR